MKAITFSRLITLAILFFTIVDAKNTGYYSQYGQDKFIHETFFSNKRDGTFVEIGASDGFFISNTYFFEKNLNWKGICIEPNPKLFSSLKKNRNCICYNCCILDCDDEKEFFTNSRIL